MSEHTPGPWRVSAGIVDNPRLIVESDMGLAVCALSLRGVQGDLARMAANAHLIAAAPDLLDALECLLIGACAVGVPHTGERAVLQDAVNIARAAIARAKGEV